MVKKKRVVSDYIKGMPTSKFIETPPELINDTNMADLSHIVSRMSAIANKRLKRMEEKGIQYSSSQYPDSIAGVRKFAAAGKTLGQLRSEYKRLYGFLNSKMSTLKGRIETYYEAKKRTFERKGEKFTESFREVREEYYKDVNIRDSFDSIGEMFAAMRNGNWLAKYGLSGLDSTQIKEVFEEVALEYGQYGFESIDTWENMLNDARNRLVDLTNNDNEYEDISTSSLI